MSLARQVHREAWSGIVKVALKMSDGFFAPTDKNLQEHCYTYGTVQTLPGQRRKLLPYHQKEKCSQLKRDINGQIYLVALSLLPVSTICKSVSF